ncbi:MAG TPA: hypothetical protein VHK22_09070 [Gaiellaceae bacterium]|jgi:hypothetical protein|nr:hypothetical protein [Gaiellaceae bacterium]
MATVLDIARHAGVSSEDVLRVLTGEPIRFETEQRVRDAIDELGRPAYPRPAGQALAPVRDAPLPARTAPEVVDSLPDTVGTIVYEAIRVEVRPMAESMAEVGSLVEELFRRLDGLAAQIAAERHERVEDLALLTDLISTGWSSVDRRLGRAEVMAERADLARSLNGANGSNGSNGSNGAVHAAVR